jgi:ABC-type dipeptide/oligopeptide/nickel transport system permease subunit
VDLAVEQRLEWTALFPDLALITTIMAVNLVGRGLTAAVDSAFARIR